eukprot:7839565-Pyramimonas_sp.AAC.1
MAQAESPLAVQIVVLPPSRPSLPFIRYLRPRSPPYLLPFVFKGFANHAWQGMNIPLKRGSIEDEEG